MPPEPSRYVVELGYEDRAYKPAGAIDNLNQAYMIYNGYIVHSGHKKRLRDRKTGKVLERELTHRHG